MRAELMNAANAVEALASTLANTWSDGSYHQLVGGWNTPAVSRRMLARRARLLADRMKSATEEDIDDDLLAILTGLPDQINFFTTQTLPQIGGSNAANVLAALEVLFSNLESAFPTTPPALPDWEEVARSDVIPKELAAKLRAIDSSVKRLEPRTGSLQSKIQAIDEAHAAALSLPTDMVALKEARDEIHAHLREVAVAAARIKAFKVEAEDFTTDVAKIDEEAKVLLDSIGGAYSAATTIGLAKAFGDRADQLRKSTQYWVALLILALGAGGLAGYLRLQFMQSLLNIQNLKAEWLWINVLMSVFAIAAPVWFAWLATRQIGQRFRLAEDYAFKASVASAYEGYRREAARLDPKLEARLFASALDRLEEPPLRFLATEEHSSPYEALLASPGLQRLMDKVPDLKDAMSSAIKQVATEAKDAGTPKPSAKGVTAKAAPQAASSDEE